MLLYCPKCQNLVDKTEDVRKDGERIEKKCQRCGTLVSYFVKYKAISTILTKEKN